MNFNLFLFQIYLTNLTSYNSYYNMDHDALWEVYDIDF